MILAWLLVPGLALLAQTAPVELDFGDALKLYGVAAPFALLCLAMVLWQRKEIADLRGTIREKDGDIADLNRDRLDRERQLVAGLGPRIFDAAQLFREGADVAARVPPADDRLDERIEQHLAGAVERLIGRMAPDDDAR